MKKNILLIFIYLMLFSNYIFANVTKTEISTLYVSIFNRASEGSGNSYWQGKGNLSDIANEMLNTDAAKEYFGSSLDSNQAFIEHIYKNTLNKTIDDDRAGIDYWVGKLSSKTRGEIVVELINAISSYAPNGANYNPNDTKTVNAYNQFTNRVTISDYMADIVEKAPSDYKTSTNFSKGLIVTSDKNSVTSAKSSIDLLANKDTGSTEQNILYSIQDSTLSGSIYLMDENGANSKKIFDFSQHPKFTTGLMLDLYSNGGKIYFTSDNGFAYGPARYNIFEAKIESYSFNQITPGENSGVWGKIGSGRVTGVVKRSNGDPYVGVPVFLEGKDMIYTDGSGNFSFSNIPEGYYWLNATRGGGSDVHDSQFIHVINGITSGPWTLTPNTGSRWSVEKPLVYQDRIYYLFSEYLNTDIKYTNRDGKVPHTTVLNYAGDKECGGDFDAFDVGKKSGQLIIIKYEQGKPCLGGIYTSDKDGNNYKQLIDMSSWNSVQDFPGTKREIYWNSNETLFTMNISIQNQNDYQIYDGILILGKDGALKSQIYAPASTSIEIYGWSNDNKWLLYSIYPSNDSNIKKLLKIRVSNDGVLDGNNIVTLIESAKILSATWAN